jgi:hypothetical protein
MTGQEVVRFLSLLHAFFPKVSGSRWIATEALGFFSTAVFFPAQINALQAHVKAKINEREKHVANMNIPPVNAGEVYDWEARCLTERDSNVQKVGVDYLVTDLNCSRLTEAGHWSAFCSRQWWQCLAMFNALGDMDFDYKEVSPGDAGDLVAMLIRVTKDEEQKGWQGLADALKPPDVQLAAGEDGIEMVQMCR